jgi:hypothetical protein
MNEYIDKHKGTCPDGWLYRDLDEKDQAPSLSFIRAGFDEGENPEGEDEEAEDSDST